MVLATNNKGKIKELKSIFEELFEEIKSLNESGVYIEIEENEDTFYKNALKKAQEIYRVVKEPVIADDSGLCINKLDGFPGVLTHRFLGENATDDEINNALIDKVKYLKDKSAKVVCALVYYDGKNTIVGNGVLNGKITTNPRGENGFGFDPIFELDSKKTLAELESDEKNKISARYLASIDLANKLKENLWYIQIF